MGLQQAVPPVGHHLRRQQPARQPRAAEIYAAAIAGGKDHPHAIRILARARIRVIYRCWLDGVPYDPARHGAAQQLYASQQAA